MLRHAERDGYTMQLHVFDPQAGYKVVERRLPHWSQAGTIAFITWRTWDSMPQAVVRAWLAEQDSWRRARGIREGAPDWIERLRRHNPQLARDAQLFVSDRWHVHLDECHGECVLRQIELAGIVAESLLHFDGSRYDLTDFVVMPNHVHVFAAFPDDDAMLAQCESWKHFTAAKINLALRRTGRFWQQDGFDHLVRSVEQFERQRRYIAENSVLARLRPGEYIHYSKPV